ncbi:MAG TPA: DUF4386 domain-containing protein [Thermoanaerobaculia bacterium]|nr:DUF4386 domain-containing protein [Thermoanaerobaculia bacterium]
MSTPTPSPQGTARAAGLFWLLCIFAGLVGHALGSRVVVSGDAAATSANLLAYEPSFRWALAADIVGTAFYLVATLLVYELLKPVNQGLSLIAAAFSLMGCASSAVSFLFHLAPLAVLGGGKYLSVFNGDQLQALAFLFLKLRGQASIVNYVFFGLHCLLVGLLVFRSAFLPRIVGALMVLAGLGWLTMSFANLLSPPLARALGAFPMMSGALGEGSLTLWLLVMGVHVPRWRERAGWVP